eukprot:3629684-Rhodomonas_salina.1
MELSKGSQHRWGLIRLFGWMGRMSEYKSELTMNERGTRKLTAMEPSRRSEQSSPTPTTPSSRIACPSTPCVSHVPV